MRTIQTEIYKFNELSDTAKENAYEIVKCCKDIYKDCIKVK